VAVSDDVGRIGAAAAAYAASGESVAAVLAVETATGDRVYLCAFTNEDGAQSWLVLDDAGAAVMSRERVRDAASIAAIVEVAEESTAAKGVGPRVASLAYLDSFGANAAGAIRDAMPAIDELTKDVESNYKRELQ
jgi:hypothetical protein